MRDFTFCGSALLGPAGERTKRNIVMLVTGEVPVIELAPFKSKQVQLLTARFSCLHFFLPGFPRLAIVTILRWLHTCAWCVWTSSSSCGDKTSSVLGACGKKKKTEYDVCL